VVQPAFIHLDNNHPLDKDQIDTFKDFNEKTSEFFNYIINLFKNKGVDDFDELNQRRDEVLNMINEIVLSRIKILKKKQKGVKISVTYLDMLNETKNLVLNVVKLAKANIKLLDTNGPEPADLEQELFD
jgi:Na+/phosphate symporter